MTPAALLVVSLIPIAHPQIPDAALRRLERAVVREISQGSAKIDLLHGEKTQKAFAIRLKTVMKEELEQARGEYFRFHWKSAEDLLKGRDDPEALALRVLIASAEGEESLSERLLVRLVRIAPKFDPKKFDYPPHFLASYEAVRRKKERLPSQAPPLLRIGEALMEEDSLPAWRARLKKVASPSEQILAVGIEPLGWHYKVFGLSENPVEIRIENLDSLPQAAKMIVKGSRLLDNLIDTSEEDEVNYK